MITFRQKSFSEYDAMRSLYTEIMRRTNGDKRKFPIIDSSALLPILKGNNIVVERFVITSSLFGKDKYRMYLKIGARAKMPDEVRLPGRYYDQKLGNLSIKFNGDIKMKTYSDLHEQKMFGDNREKGSRSSIVSSVEPFVSVERRVKKLLGEAIKYDKAERSLVLEFSEIGDAIEALNILPFGMDYKIYLLNA